MNFEQEINDLKRRVGNLEGAVGVLTGHLQNVHPELQQLKEISQRNFTNMDLLMSRFIDRLDTMNTQVWGLRDDLPELVATAMKNSLD